MPRGAQHVAVVGGGPSGMTAALLLARAGHAVTLFEAGARLGGLWACRHDEDGHYLGENSCKVYQSSYVTSPALFRAIGTRWQDHFVARHDLVSDWLRPFLRDCSLGDLAKLAGSFARHASGDRRYRELSVGEYLERHRVGEACQAWMRATALGGITGTLRMTMWELFHRLEGNLGAIVGSGDGVLHWNAQPPSSRDGFLAFWEDALVFEGVTIETGVAIRSLEPRRSGVAIRHDGGSVETSAVFLAVPPPAFAAIVRRSPDSIASAFGRSRPALERALDESVYEHLGITWTFDRPLDRPLPLGGHNVRRGWHPILIEHPQYRPYLRPPAVTAVVGSVAVDTPLLHPRLRTRARDHGADAIAEILWDDERAVDPALPRPIGASVHGLSSATQIVHHGALGIRAPRQPIFVATSLSGAAPYFTASLESAIQAGAAAAAAFDPGVERLPTGSRSHLRPRALRRAS